MLLPVMLNGALQNLEAIVRREEPFYVLVHCGDGVDDISRIHIPATTRVIKVTGNVDISRGYIFERTIVEEIQNKRIMVTHGDMFRVDRDMKMLLEEGMQQLADLICFGHTHTAFYLAGEIALFSPGAVSDGLYGVIKIGADIRCQHKTL